jgi:hypothetical protein
MELRPLTVAAAAAVLVLAPLLPAEATPVGGCPRGGEWFTTQFGDIPEIPLLTFDAVDLNEDGTLCARRLPEQVPDAAQTGNIIDNVVGGGRPT